jgi:hypothetical protein
MFTQVHQPPADKLCEAKLERGFPLLPCGTDKSYFQLSTFRIDFDRPITQIVSTDFSLPANPLVVDDFSNEHADVRPARDPSVGTMSVHSQVPEAADWHSAGWQCLYAHLRWLGENPFMFSSDL